MTDWADYELLDFGDARKLERFGPWVLDRPCPAAAGVAKQSPAAWRDVTARYDADRTADGAWSRAAAGSARSRISFNLDESHAVAFDLELLPTGQVGVFPEQADCWGWIARQAKRAVTQAGTPGQSPGLRVLNLFAYTGGSTLAAAAAGAEVVHVDAAKSVVARARQNAAASGLADRPIRWIVEDAVRFCQREVKRGNRYDAIILDPPTYGHGPKGEEWLIKRDLLPLLELCGELVDRQPKFVLLTCHTPGIGESELAAYLADGVFGSCSQPPRTGELFLETADDRNLSSGVFARWPG